MTGVSWGSSKVLKFESSKIGNPIGSAKAWTGYRMEDCVLVRRSCPPEADWFSPGSADRLIGFRGKSRMLFAVLFLKQS